MTATTHQGVVTLVHGGSLYLWDLDDDAPWHVARKACRMPVPKIGAVVRIVIENGRPTTIDPSSEASLSSRQKQTLRSVIDVDEVGELLDHK